MQKSQELGPVLGLDDGMYYAHSVSYDSKADKYMHQKWLDLYARLAEGRQSAASYMTMPYGSTGWQTFSSTDRPRPYFNNCTNIKVHPVNYPVTYRKQSYRRPTRYSGVEFCRYSLAGNISDATPSKPDWADADGAQRRAWWSMQPRFEGEFQALNFLYELKDFKDIAKHLSRINFKNIRGNLASIKRKINYAATRVKQGSTSSNLLHLANTASKTMAEVYLAKTFAIDPTVRDVMTLHAQLVTLVNDVQNQFFERGKDKQTSHFSETLDESSSTTIGTNDYYWQLYGWIRKVTFTATMEYRYEYRYRTWFDALKRYYGLNLNSSVVWNALPFTFVVDYFLKVGQAIDFMQTDPNVELRLMQYCESVLSEATSGKHYSGDTRAAVLINGGSGGSADGGQAQIGDLYTGWSGTWYNRRVTSPNKGAALPRITLPSDKQVTNLVALLRALW